MSNSRFNLSAANVMIELPIGRPVGNVQNVTLNINHNQQQIKNLHNTHIQGFVKGFTINSASAARGIIDYETFFGDHNSLFQYFTTLENLSKTSLNSITNSTITGLDTTINLPSTSSKIPIRDVLGGIGNFLMRDGNAIDIREALSLFEKLTTGEISVSDLFGSLEFNLVAKGDVDLWRLEGCVLQSRSIKVDVGEMIIMENIEILAKRFVDINLNLIGNF